MAPSFEQIEESYRSYPFHSDLLQKQFSLSLSLQADDHESQALILLFDLAKTLCCMLRLQVLD